MQSPRLMDYHLHTAVTIDGKMDEISACERAISRGISEIAFTNHVMLNKPAYTMSPASLQKHWEMIQICQSRFPQLTIRLGIETDYYPGRETEIAALIDQYERLINRQFDIVLGSVHEVNGGFFSNKNLASDFFSGRDLLSLYSDYFDLASKAAQSRLFDVMAHPDLIKKYTHNLTPPIPFDLYRSSVIRLVDAMISTGVGLEVNTKGLKLPVKEAYPSNDFLQIYLSKNKATGTTPIITLGSDAHNLDDIGLGIAETAENLQRLGVSTLASFDKRVKTAIHV